jgi:hypothetical protein
VFFGFNSGISTAYHNRAWLARKLVIDNFEGPRKPTALPAKPNRSRNNLRKFS